ncbi:MAG: DNA-binding protein [Mesorhizobium sp.]|nr:MAG: DNA-binding protein [Mesorhizobium sp.]
MLLTQAEVAERLRCSEQKVKRLRKSKELAYIPGRPVLIDEHDLIQYLERNKCPALPPISKRTKKAPGTSIGPRSESESASALARRIWLARKNFSRRGSR